MLLSLLAAAILACAAVFEAATQTQAAVDVASTAQRTPSPQLRERILRGAATRLQSSWARPALWSADAAEALSAVEALRGNAVGGAAAHYAESMHWATRATKLGPAQARSWARLAEFSLMGVPGAPCEPHVCLERSWAAAPMSDAAFDCARLRLAYAAGGQAPSRERVAWYLRSGVGSDDAAACLTFLPRAEVLQLMLQARSAAE
ncbi:MAG: hypothetical protein ACREH4_00490 [Vitreimonas sp.]